MIINGDCLDKLREMPDNSVDCVVTDPPYGLGKEPAPCKLMKDWVEKGFSEIKGTGFMGKEWDAFVPQPIIWKEVYRVLKPGGHVLSFFGTRTYDWGVVAMRLAGFEIRDQINWIYGSGFPKGLSVGKAIDKMRGAEREVIGEKIGPDGIPYSKRRPPQNEKQWNEYSATKYDNAITAPATPDAIKWKGWGTALKPANEPIVVARKPLEKGLTIAENVLKWGCGAINIDGCRIGNTTRTNSNGKRPMFGGNSFFEGKTHNAEIKIHNYGRWPANLILDEEAGSLLDEQSGIIKTGSIKPHSNRGSQFNSSKEITGSDKGDSGGASRFFKVIKEDKYDMLPLCEDIDAASAEKCANTGNISVQSDVPELPPPDREGKKPRENTIFPTAENSSRITHPTEQATALNIPGSANATESGFAPTKFLYQAKASKSERNRGLEGMPEKDSGIKNGSGRGFSETDPYKKITNNNFHPTVKPIRLMEYLIKLICPPGGTVLDPFAGSGSTGVAAKKLGFEFIGIEKEKEYFKIAEKRIEAVP